MKILVVEKDERLAKLLEAKLNNIAEIDIAGDAELAMQCVEESYYDLIIVDNSMSGLSGVEYIKTIRKINLTPIIVLSHIEDIDKKIECLNVGADDYMTKPFNVDELFARVKAILRRVNTNFNVFNYNFANLEVNFLNKMLMVDGKYIQLNRKTYEILELLVRNKEMIMTKQQLFDRIWGYYSNTVQTVVEINIFRLRKILSEFGLDKYLRTVKSTGYMWSEKV